MFPSAKAVCLRILILCGVITFATSDCDINFPEDPDIRPTFYKYVGTHKLKIDTNSVGVIKLHENQKIEAHCDYAFQNHILIRKFQQIYALCKESYIYIQSAENQPENEYNSYSHRRFSAECSRTTWDLYESNYNFHWCPTNVTSFILARNDSMYPTVNSLAGICYNIFNSSFNSVYYTLGPHQIENYQPDILADMYRPGLNIPYIEETFGSNSLPPLPLTQDQLFYSPLSEYGFSSIIQHQKLHYAYNNKFSTLLEFLWWPNLRLYNWKHYLHALEKHVENDNKLYDILAGVSGALRVPIKKGCANNYSMEEIVIVKHQKIPLYVWNYLQETTNRSNELVIIGFNSPFHEAYPESDNAIIFCEDRCREIPWLKDASAAFRYNIMGIVFCCNVEDVRSSGRLIGFPEIEIKAKPVEDTELPSASYEVQSNEIDDDDYKNVDNNLLHS